MKIEIRESADIKEILVEIQCNLVDKNILKLEHHIRLFSKTLLAKNNRDFVQIPIHEIFYM